MGLNQWTLKKLGAGMERMARQLRDPVLAGEFLDQARQDTPLVADILQHIAVATVSGPRRGRNRDLELLRRDLLLFLTLRELEQKETTAMQARQVNSN